MNNNTSNSDEMNKELIEQLMLFIKYGIKKQDLQIAEDTINSYAKNPMVLRVLYDFYSRMPECREEAASKVNKIVSRQAMYLLGVTTENFEYLFFYNGEESFYLGEKKDGIEDSEILNYFGYTSNKDFLKQQTTSSTLPVSSLSDKESKTFCPACSVAEGEIHQLGCPVETCPWCEGQLSYCNCRFDKLGVGEIVGESELDLLEIILNEKGRIPFSKGESPAYPEDGRVSESSE